MLRWLFLAAGVAAFATMLVVGSQLAVVLLTRERFEDLPKGLGGEGYVVVFFPYSYQVGRFTMIVPRQSVQSLDMRLEDAMRFIVTAGAKAGESRSPQERPDAAESVGATVRE